MRKFYVFPVLIFLFGFIFPAPSFAQNVNCSDRYVTVINPVRGRDLWKNKSLLPLQDQYSLVDKYGFSASWLLQYDALIDPELSSEVANFNNQQELGVLLEVSKKLADNSRVIYPYDIPWYRPGAVFLSGYSRTERRKLIDLLFNDFKDKFGYYPKSVGAWWIDSYSLDYIKSKYGLESALIVADQKTTDNYGIWGQWWGVPYFSTKMNVLVPARTLADKQDVVILQWAQRHPILGFGDGYRSSYSLQANDYLKLGQNTSFFKDLVNVYLDCRNLVGQVTIGLETGMESVDFIDEYETQLKILKENSLIKSVTMSDFSQKFRQVYPGIVPKAEIGLGLSLWEMDTSKRNNNFFNEEVVYNQKLVFQDYFVADRSDFLNRRLESPSIKNIQNNNIILLIVIFGLGIYSLINKVFRLWLIWVVYVLGAYGLVLKVNYQHGWWVYYGPVFENVLIYQLSILLVSFSIFLIFWKKFLQKLKIVFYVLPLTFAFEYLVKVFRWSQISGTYYLGVNTDSLHFLGLSWSKGNGLQFVNRDFEAYLSAGLWRFNFSQIWENEILWLVVFPCGFIFVAFLLANLLRLLDVKIKFIVVGLLAVLSIAGLVEILSSDPVYVFRS